MSKKSYSRNILYDVMSLSYGNRNKVYLSRRATDNLSFTQRLKLASKLDVHNGCVNTICWNDTGQYILSGSDDQHLVVVNPFSGKVEISFHSAHRANIFSAKFLPNTQDKQTISCSADGSMFYCDFERPELLNANGFDCHPSAVYEVLTVPNDSYSFLSCGEDGTVRWFDLRTKTRCNKANCEEDILINSRQAVMSIAINPMMPFQLAIGCADSSVRVYDRRQLGTGATGNDPTQTRATLHAFSAPSVSRRKHRITSLMYSSDGEEILVSYSSEHLYLFNLKEKEGENCVPLKKSFKETVEVGNRGIHETSNGTGASASASSPNETVGESVFRPSILKQPPVKRLRLRGDWSDTGPDARPERERTQQEEGAASIMQRMSNMLMRLLEGRLNQDRNISANEQASGDIPPPESQDSNILADATGVTLDESTAGSGIDEDVPTSESSLSNSDGSVATFLSFSPSEGKDDSGDNSKESFETSEDASPGGTKEKELAQNSSEIEGIHIEHCDQNNMSDSASCEVVENTLLLNQKLGSDLHLEMTEPENSTTISVCQDISNGVAVIMEPVVDVGNENMMDVITSEAQSANIIPRHAAESFYSGDASNSITGCDGLGKILEACQMCDRLGDLHRCPEVEQNVCNISDVADVLTTELSGNFCDPCKSSESKHLVIESQKNERDIKHVMDVQAVSASDLPVIQDSSPCSTLSDVMVSSDNSRYIPDEIPELYGDDLRRKNMKDSSWTSQGIVGIDKQRETGVASASDITGSCTESTNRYFSCEDDSDLEEEYASDASREAWQKQRMEEKNAAASKLQAVFRKRLEQKHKIHENLLSLSKPTMKQRYIGHRNSRTMIKEATFWGNKYVMSGSDCGHIFIWDRHTAKLVMLLEGDKHVVNCLQPHPYDPILASSGIDYDVKLWMPALESPCFNYPKAADLMQRNEIMLEETRDTVTVPASFMLRMLLSLNHARRDNQPERSGGSGSQSSSGSSRDE